MSVMARTYRLILLAAVVFALFIPSAALAHGQRKLPPGNSAANEYTESFPTAGGGTPSGGIHIGGGGRAPTGGSAVPNQVVSDLDRSGAVGKHAAAVDKATGSLVSQPKHTLTKANLSGPTSSSTDQVIKTLDGSSGGGGLGILLPAILIVSLLGASAAGMLRRRGTA